MTARTPRRGSVSARDEARRHGAARSRLDSIAGRAALAMLGASLATPLAAQQQEMVHVGASAGGRLTQVVRLEDAWSDPSTSFFSSEPRDVVAKSLVETGEGRRESVDLLLHGPWGTHHYAFAALDEIKGPVVHSFTRVDRLAFDIDDDGRKEIVLIERSAEATRRIDEYGDPLPGDAAGPFLTSYRVSARYLDREDGALVEEDLPLDAEDPRVQRLLDRALVDRLRMVLQQALGDHDFAAHRFEAARYRYRVVREWAERTLSSRKVSRLGPGQPLREVDPDDGVVLWTAASLRQEALPRAFR